MNIVTIIVIYQVDGGSGWQKITRNDLKTILVSTGAVRTRRILHFVAEFFKQPRELRLKSVNILKRISD